MSIPLPNELFRAIVEHVDENDTKTLLALMCTNRVMQAEAERILYRTFQVSTAASNVMRYLQSYLKRLEDSRHLAKYITHFHLSDFGSTFMGEAEADALFTLIESVLHKTTSLKEISIEDLAGHARMHKMLATLQVSPEILSFETQSSHPPIEYERLFHSILANARHFTALKHIDLHSKANRDCWTNRSSCPQERCSGTELARVLGRIQSLAGDGYILRRLLQHCRSVSSLRWYATEVYPTLKCCVAHACRELLPNAKLDSVESLWVGDSETEVGVVIGRPL